LAVVKFWRNSEAWAGVGGKLAWAGFEVGLGSRNMACGEDIKGERTKLEGVPRKAAQKSIKNKRPVTIMK